MSELKLIVVEENVKLSAQTSWNKSKTETLSWYQGLSDLGSKFSHVDGKPGISGSRIFGSQF